MKPAPFEYHAPETVADAVQLLADLGDGAKVLAGGQSLVPMLALRLTRFEHLVDIGRIAELQGSEARTGALWIGAGTTQARVEASTEVASSVPLLARATPFIGHFQIRNRGTLGGSIAHADPAAEYPAVALTLDAQMEVASAHGRRTIPARDFFDGMWSTNTEPDELLVGVSFPTWGSRSGFAVEEFARRHGDFAIAGATIGIEVDGDDRITRRAIGLIGLGSTPERARAAEAELVGRPITDVEPDEVGRLAMTGLTSVPEDLHGSAAYRTRVGAAMVARAWTEARLGGARWLTSTVQLTVNGQARHATVEPRTTLADFLREQCRLTGTHLGCEHGVCGACTVLVDGAAVRACLVFAVQAEGTEVTTIEGIAGPDGELSPVQSAFRDCHGLQCGFCTPGFVVSVTAFLRDNPDPSDQDIREALSGNLCRCTGYQGIVNAVRQAAGAPAEGDSPMTEPTAPAAARYVGHARAPSRRRAPAHRRRHLRRRHCAPGHAARVLRPQRLRPGRDPEHRHVRRARPARRPLRLHRRRPEPGREGAVAHVDRRRESRDTAPAARRRRGALRR